MANKYKSTFWDERYSSEEYVYGTEPNKFFKEQLDKIPTPGKLLLPGEGDGVGRRRRRHPLGAEAQ